MRILYYFMVVCLVFTFGCAGTKPERTILQENIFFSPHLPKMKIKINPEFKYIGKAEEKEYVKYVDLHDGSHVEMESYIFGHIEDNKIKEGVIIGIFTGTGGYWKPDLFGWVKNKLDSGVMKIQGIRYQYMVVASSKALNKYEINFIRDKGYIIPNCLLVKAFGKRVGTDKKIKIIIGYAEDITHIHGNKYSCRDWNNANLLTNEQREYLKEFIDRSEKNIQIL